MFSDKVNNTTFELLTKTEQKILQKTLRITKIFPNLKYLILVELFPNSLHYLHFTHYE